MPFSYLRAAAAALSLFALSAPSRADFSAAIAPAFRGAACTDYAQWEAFTIPHGGVNSPDVAGSTNSTATLEQLIPGAILTSTGNIYHPFAIPAFTMQDASPADLQQVSLQLSTFGSSRNSQSFILQYTNAQGVQTLAPTHLAYLVQTAGHDELLIEWDLASISDEVTSYSLSFIASAASLSLDAVILDKRWSCAGAGYCFGDGTGTACPCGNVGAAGRGCENSIGTGGGRLTGSGYALVANDSLVLTAEGLPGTVSTLFFQGDAQTGAGAGVAFGDGLRCAGGTVLRLGSRTTSGGSVSFGSGIGVDPDISVAGLVSAAGTTRYYQAWYRNAATFCTPSPFNLTNGYAVTWY